MRTIVSKLKLEAIQMFMNRLKPEQKYMHRMEYH